MLLLGIALGGATGAVVRHLLASSLASLLAGGSWAHFPLGTLVVNVVGSYLFAFLAAIGLAGLIPREVQLALGAGFLGALTTFSSFEFEADALARGGEWRHAAFYLLGNLLLGYLALLLGRLSGQAVAAS